jgi:hypothetical protein
MTVRIYSSLDTGAPSLANLSTTRMVDNLKAILMACLVNGYNSKLAAGWTVGHEHADGFSLGNGAGFLNIVLKASNSVTLYIMEAITSGATALAGGTNRRSGPWCDGSSESGRQYLYADSFYAASANKQWCVVADEKTVTIVFSAITTAVDVGAGAGGALHFGAYTTALGVEGFCCLGGNASQYSGSSLLSRLYGMTLRNPFNGLVEQGLGPRYGVLLPTAGGGQVSLTARGKVVQPDLTLLRAAMYTYGPGTNGASREELSSWCGRLRGLVSDSTLNSIVLSQVLPAMGLASPVWQDRFRPLSVPGLTHLVPLYAMSVDLGCFVSLNAADWT